MRRVQAKNAGLFDRYFMGDVMKLSEYFEGLKNKRVTVVGAGISNSPLIEALLKHDVHTTVCDKRSVEQLGETYDYFLSLGAVFNLGEDYLDSLDADVIFRTPGLMPFDPAIADAVEKGAVLTSEMELFFEVCPCKIIGITGSDGKTTTTSIIAQLLKSEGLCVHVGGNIGNPLLMTADDMDPSDVVVLELSSFQLITMKKCPSIAIVTNLSPNHLDVHKDMDDYKEAKRNIFLRQNVFDVAIFNLDNEYTSDYAASAPGHIRYFSRQRAVDDGVYTDGETIFDAVDGKITEIMKVSDILLPGVHNIENYLAALAAVRGFVSRETMIETAHCFSGVAHRIELVRELDGVRFYNDSIASSPSRTIAGLRSFDRKVILIAGGKDKGIAFDELGDACVSYVKTLVLTGVTAQAIREAVEGASGYSSGYPEIIAEDDFEEAVRAAAAAAKDGDVVLLSPACTSFDKFRNFEHRGDVFREIVRGLE